ncbi:ABC transporter permease [Actinomycetaceae bacterium MB13-C1-2]|nr:ABC transporter permease [Actinomycetaceae bacterium MB13-C1-2]
MSTTPAESVRPKKPIWSYWFLIYTFGQRDLKSKFKGSALGWLWSLVVPLATIGIYSVVFSIILRVEPPDFGSGRKGLFVVWLFCGLIFWTFFSNTVNNGIAEMLSAGQILQKVYFPAYAPVLGSALAVGVQSLIEFGILAIIMLFLGNVSWTWLLIPVWMVFVVIFVGSIATIFAILNVYAKDVAHLVAIALQLLFYATPIIYPLSMVGGAWGGNLVALLQANPLTGFVTLFRSLMYELTPGNLYQWGMVAGAALVSLGLATWVVRTKGEDLGEHA